jgi:hypothetical protein
MSQPWSQRKGESSKAYQAFLFYLEDRAKTQFAAYIDYCRWNWDKARAEHEQSTRNEPPRSFKGWASKFDWSERRRAYYADVDAKALDTLMESKAGRKVDRVELLDELRAVLEEWGAKYLRALFADGKVNVKDLTALLDKLYRNYREELNDLPTEKSEVDASVTYELAFTSRDPVDEDGDGD